MYKIFIPDGTPTGIEAEITSMSDETRRNIQWSNLFYEDGHKEGTLFIGADSFHVEEAV